MIMNIHLIKDPGGTCALTQIKQSKKKSLKGQVKTIEINVSEFNTSSSGRS